MSKLQPGAETTGFLWRCQERLVAGVGTGGDWSKTAASQCRADCYGWRAKGSFCQVPGDRLKIEFSIYYCSVHEKLHFQRG